MLGARRLRQLVAVLNVARLSTATESAAVRPMAGELLAYPFPSTMVNGQEVDPQYPGTAVSRLRAVLTRVSQIDTLDGPWDSVRRALLQAGGLKEDYSTSHAFNDDNHCDLTTMVDGVSFEHNANGAVAQISRGNQLGNHIKHASLASHGPGGSWSTCTNGAHLTPPNDVAHTQFSSRVAFKLVWVPNDFVEFVLVDDEGNLLKRGKPTGNIPSERSRRGNYALVRGGKYAAVADRIAAGEYVDAKVCDSGIGSNGTVLGA